MVTLKQATERWQLGYALIPVNPDKSPTSVIENGENIVKNWTRWSQDKQVENDMRYMFFDQRWGMGWVLPKDVVVLDFDEKKSHRKAHMANTFLELLGDDDFYMQQTQSKNPISGKRAGHLIYRTDAIQDRKIGFASQCIGGQHASIGVIDILSGHSGSYILIDPTPGYDWVTYKGKLRFGPVHEIPFKTKEQHDRILAVLQSMDERQVDRQSQVTRDHNKKAWTREGESPIENWLANINLYDCHLMLDAAGWKYDGDKGGQRTYIRPTKAQEGRPGLSATLREVDGRISLYVFSGEGAFESMRSYDPMGIYACTKHNGYFAAAGRAIFEAYAGRSLAACELVGFERKPQPEPAEPARANVSEDLDVSALDHRFFKMKQAPDLYQYRYQKGMTIEWTAFWKYNSNGHSYLMGGEGMIMSIIGHAGTRKTTFLSTIIDNAFSGQTRLNMSVDLAGRSVIAFDYEQSKYAFVKQGQKLDRWQGEGMNYYRFTDMTKQRKRDHTMAACEKHRPSIIILDNAKELCFDAMDENSSDEAMSLLMYLRDHYNALVIPMLHKSKASIGGRGNFGSVLEFYSDAMLDFSFPEQQWGKKMANPPTRITFRKLRDDKRPEDLYVTHGSDGFLKLSETNTNLPGLDYTDDDLGTL